VPPDVAFQAIASVMVELDGVATVQFLKEGQFLSVWSTVE